MGKSCTRWFESSWHTYIASAAEVFVEHDCRTNDLQINAQPQRRYPWGNEIDDDCVNHDMKVGETSTPGVYPQGISPYGCHDLAGNVWEWTRSDRGDYPYPAIDTAAWKQRESGGSAVCVLRGGAFSNLHRNVRCAVGYDGRPDDRYNFIGFRVVLSPLR